MTRQPSSAVQEKISRCVHRLAMHRQAYMHCPFPIRTASMFTVLLCVILDKTRVCPACPKKLHLPLLCIWCSCN